MAASSQSSGRNKASALGIRLRRLGLRPIQIWVPDVRFSKFEIAAHRQSLAVARSQYAHHDQEFVDAISNKSDE